MKQTIEDKRLLEELCRQHGVSADKVLQLLDTVRDYEFKERRTGSPVPERCRLPCL